MNFEDAIKAHAEWKIKLGSYLKKPDGSLNPSVVEKDNQCELGKWIYGEGTKFRSLAEYTALKTDHAQFHQCAGAVIRKIDAKAGVSEDSLLGMNSEYSKASGKVLRAIKALQAAIPGTKSKAG